MINFVTLVGVTHEVIAEEKEKNTLRTLVLNNVKATEILFAKALICLTFVVLDNILIYFIMKLPMQNFVIYQLIGFFVGLAAIFFGAIIGLMSKIKCQLKCFQHLLC